MSAKDMVGLPATGGAGVLSDDDVGELRAALAAEREARASAAAAAQAQIAKLETDLRTLATLRDNFHNLYREERELRTAAEQSADGFTEVRDRLESEVVSLKSEVDRLERLGARAQPPPTAPPATPPPAAAPEGLADRHLAELEHELAMMRAHAADLETALVEREVALAEAAAVGASDQPAEPPAPNAELTAATRRIHDLDGELAELRKEHAAARTAHDRLASMRQALEEQLSAEQTQRAEAQRVAAEAGLRTTEAVRRETEAVAEATTLRDTAERTDRDLQAAKAGIGVLEQRLRDAEAARAAAETRVQELEEELSFVRSNVLTGHAAPTTRRPLLRRRGNNAEAATPHVETKGNVVEHATPVEVAAPAEDVESALHRRLFGEP